jgi:hypothetical protein
MKCTINENNSVSNFKNGDIVSHKETEIVILVTGESVYKDQFTGVTLHHFNPSKIAACDDDWVKDQFELFTGSLVLEN